MSHGFKINECDKCVYVKDMEHGYVILCLHVDDMLIIGRAQSNMYNGKSRHIGRRHNTIRQLLLTRVISIDYVKSKDDIVDSLTKGLNGELVEKSSKEMGLKPVKE